MKLNAVDFREISRTVLLTASLLLSGCGHDLPSVDVEQVQIIASADANADTAVAVDLVLVMDPLAIEGVANLSAAQWFSDRSQVTLAFPAGIVVRSFEVVPRQTLGYALTSDDQDAVAAYVFARYSGPGAHRARVDRLEKVTVRLNKSTFVVEPGS